MRRSPSVTGDAEPYGLASCVGSFSECVMLDCQRTLPSVRFRHTTVRRFSFSIACVMKTRSRQTIGDELPRSGSGTFQRTFSVALHRTGRLVSSVTPEPLGPC